jgi:hypothetical protein
VVVHLVLQTLLADLVETVELVEVHGIAIRHDEKVEDDGHSALLAESRRPDLLGLAQDDRPFRDEDVLVVMRVEGIGDEHLDRANCFQSMRKQASSTWWYSSKPRSRSNQTNPEERQNREADCY